VAARVARRFHSVEINSPEENRFEVNQSQIVQKKTSQRKSSKVIIGATANNEVESIQDKDVKAPII
jgi:hypothetical protein